jgi:RimJ/RimL family protein N-acetyltransferase
MAIHVRPLAVGDAVAIHALFAAIDAETQYLLFEPGERTRDVAGWQKRIEELEGDSPDAFFVAEDEPRPGDMVGLLGVNGETLQRLRHSASIVVAVRQTHAGRGIATRLFGVMEEWARGRGLYRIHLQVQCDNHRAVALYHRLGYRVEGTHRCAVKVGGRWVDDYTMAKLLE